jgi:hypothetical protein
MAVCAAVTAFSDTIGYITGIRTHSVIVKIVVPGITEMITNPEVGIIPREPVVMISVIVVP